MQDRIGFMSDMLSSVLRQAALTLASSHYVISHFAPLTLLTLWKKLCIKALHIGKDSCESLTLCFLTFLLYLDFEQDKKATLEYSFFWALKKCKSCLSHRPKSTLPAHKS